MERLNLFILKAYGMLDDLRTRQEGQTMAEYAVILTVITAAVLAALVLLSGNITNVINTIAGKIKIS